LEGHSVVCSIWLLLCPSITSWRSTHFISSDEIYEENSKLYSFVS